MSQRIAGCCCKKSDCDGTTLGTCCYTDANIDPNCQGFCEGYDQLNNLIGRIDGTTSSECDSYIGLEVGILDDGSIQIVARVQWTAYGSCETPEQCFCKEDISCAECTALGGEWQNAIPCAIACNGTCCVKNADGTIARCFDARNKCECKQPTASTQTYTFARGLNCATQGCVVQYCTQKSKWWKATKTTQQNFWGFAACASCNVDANDPNRPITSENNLYIDERYFHICSCEEGHNEDYSQYDRVVNVDLGTRADNDPLPPNTWVDTYKYVFVGIKESCFADGVCISNCDCVGEFEGFVYKRETRVTNCCTESGWNYDRESNSIIPSPFGSPTGCTLCGGGCCIGNDRTKC